MTQDMMTLRALWRRQLRSADLLREMIGFTAERLYGTGGRGPDRRRSRRALGGSYHPFVNGYRDRSWETRARHGRAEDPEVIEEGELLPGLPEPRRMAEKRWLR